MQNYFYCLRNLPDLDQDSINEANRSTFVEEFKPHVFRAKCSFDHRSELIKSLRKEFINVRSTWLMNPPNSMYDWHSDKFGRNCAINIPVKMPIESGAFFRKKMNPEEPKYGKYFHLYKIDYELYKPTILNVLEEHCVMNLSDQERIILSISIENENVFYKDVVEFMKTLI